MVKGQMGTKIDRWQHLGHSLGECWHDSQGSVSFIHIPKNASSFVKGCLISSGRFAHSPSLVTADTYIVTLRDPVDRWCSGIAQFASAEVNKHLSMDQLLEQVTWDDHTELQTYFLQGVDLSKAVFFRVDQNLKNNLANWLKLKDYKINVDDLVDLNTSEANGNLALKQRFQSLMGNLDGMSPIKLKLLKHFATDVELINSVEFYDSKYNQY